MTPWILRRALCAAAFLLAAMPIRAWAQPAVVPQGVTAPLPKLREGTRIRVWSDAPLQVGVLSSKPEFYEGSFRRWDGDSLTFDMNEPVATVVEIPIGRIETENTVPLLWVTRLERQRIGTTRRRLAVGAALGAAAGGAMALAADQCGEAPCSAGARAVGGVLTFGLVTGFVAVRRFWEEVPLPGR